MGLELDELFPEGFHIDEKSINEALENNACFTGLQVGKGNNFNLSFSPVSIQKKSYERVQQELEEFFMMFSFYKLRRFHKYSGNKKKSDNQEKYKELINILEKGGVKITYFSDNFTLLSESLFKLLNGEYGEVGKKKKYLSQFSSFFSFSSFSENRTYDPDTIDVSETPISIPYQINESLYGYESIIEFNVSDFDLKKDVLRRLGIDLKKDGKVLGIGEGKKDILLSHNLFADKFPLHQDEILEDISKINAFKSLELSLQHFQGALKGLNNEFSYYPSWEFGKAVKYYNVFYVNYIKYLEYYYLRLSKISKESFNKSEKNEIEKLKKIYIDYLHLLDEEKLFSNALTQDLTGNLKVLFLHNLYRNLKDKNISFLNIDEYEKSLKMFVLKFIHNFDDFYVFDSFLNQILNLKKISYDKSDYQKNCLEEIKNGLEAFLYGLEEKFSSCYDEEIMFFDKELLEKMKGIYLNNASIYNGENINLLTYLKIFITKINEYIDKGNVSEIDITQIYNVFSQIKQDYNKLFTENITKINEDIESKYNKNKFEILDGIYSKIDIGLKNSFLGVSSQEQLKKVQVYFFMKYLEKNNKIEELDTFLLQKSQLESIFFRYITKIQTDFIIGIPKCDIPEIEEIKSFFDTYDIQALSSDKIDVTKNIIEQIIAKITGYNTILSTVFTQYISSARKKSLGKSVFDIGSNIAYQRMKILKQNNIQFQYFETEYTRTDGVVYCEEYQENKLNKSYLIKYSPDIF